jgi:predicted dienelactone hydrolase
VGVRHRFAPARDMNRDLFTPPSPRDRIEDPFAGADPPSQARVDWWAWQSRIRAVSTPVRTPTRSARRPPLVARAGLGILVGAALVTATFGGVVFGGRSTEAARAEAVVPGPVFVGSPPEYQHLGDAPPPAPPPAPAPEAEPEPPRLASSGPFAVERVVLDLSYDGRRLQTVVRIPADRGAGPFPMVVFAHGYGTQTGAYGPLLDGIAAAGFVVVAPEFPFTSTAYGGDLGGRDVEAQVDDVRHAISAVRDLAHATGSPLEGLVNDGRVGVVGHSDGGVTAGAVAFASQVRDARIGAAVLLSGARNDFGGSWFTAGAPALLAIHGDADGVNPFGASQTLYSSDRSGAPRYLVAVAGGGHDDAFVGSRSRPAVAALVADFLRAYLVDDANARARIADDASVDGVLDLVASDD